MNLITNKIKIYPVYYDDEFAMEIDNTLNTTLEIKDEAIHYQLEN